MPKAINSNAEYGVNLLPQCTSIEKLTPKVLKILLYVKVLKKYSHTKPFNYGIMKKKKLNPSKS